MDTSLGGKHQPEGKTEREHIEDAAAPVHTHDAQGEDIATGLVKSRFDNAGVWATLWKFRTSALYCFALYTAFVMDGFEVTMSVSCGRGVASGASAMWRPSQANTY